MRRRIPLLAAVAAVAALAGPAIAAPAGPILLPLPGFTAHAHRLGAAVATDSAASRQKPHYDVTITRTAYGIPHIVGADFGSVGYGYGYAFAEDNICTMAADYITVEGKRSRWFGPAKSYTMQGNGVSVTNLDSDFFWTEVQQSHVVDGMLHRPAPFGPRPAVKQAVRGYVAGYNRYLHDVGGAEGIKDPACHNAGWVHPITTHDAYLRFYQIVLLAGEDVAMPGIADAQPPSPDDPLPGVTGAPDPARTSRLLTDGWHQTMGGLGSNAVAVGSDGTKNGHGLLLGNPHFPWTDTERFYQAHLVIPGKLDVSGASLFGVPVVLIGHTKTMAWSHTVSTAFRFTPYQLTLVPGDPTSYLFDV